MRDLAGKTAFVTGGASGIGFALGRAFAIVGMRVMLADIEADALATAVESLRDLGPDVRGVTCDVADPANVEDAATACRAAFGNVHVVCNNAGVGGGSGIDDIALDTWRWVLDVNLMGVLHGIRTFLPPLRAHGEGGHIVNTASMAGMLSGLGFSPYAASKFAVVAMSEGLAAQVVPLDIGVTVLCPGFVRTRISESGRNRPSRYGPRARPIPLARLASSPRISPRSGDQGLIRRTSPCASLPRPREAMTGPVHPAIRRYATGEISANKAADLLGDHATVADVFVLTREAGLPLPRPPREREQAELAHAMKVLGLQ